MPSAIAIPPMTKRREGAEAGVGVGADCILIASGVVCPEFTVTICV